MARRAPRPLPEPSGSLLIWLAGLVFGVGAGIVLVYHLLLASHAGDMPLEVAAASAQQSSRAASAIDSAHAEALKAAQTVKTPDAK